MPAFAAVVSLPDPHWLPDCLGAALALQGEAHGSFWQEPLGPCLQAGRVHGGLDPAVDRRVVTVRRSESPYILYAADPSKARQWNSCFARNMLQTCWALNLSSRTYHVVLSTAARCASSLALRLHAPSIEAVAVAFNGMNSTSNNDVATMEFLLINSASAALNAQYTVSTTGAAMLL